MAAVVRLHNLSRYAAGLGTALVLLGVLCGALQLSGLGLSTAVPAWVLCSVGAVFWGIGTWRSGEITQALSIEAFTDALLLLLLSDWLSRGFCFYPGFTIRGEIAVLGILATALIRSIPNVRLERWLLLGAIIAGIWGVLATIGDHQLISDDHASFFYRLTLLQNYFPSIPFYNPEWNGGFDARDFFATGSLSVFFLTWPFMALLDAPGNYTAATLWILFVITPLCLYWAARILTQSTRTASLAAALTLCSGLIWYRWGLGYGTLGFMISAALSPLVYALFVQCLTQQLSRNWLIVLVVTTTLMLFWAASSLILAPLGLALAINCRSIFRQRSLLLALIILAAINLPWMTVFLKVSKVGSFVAAAPVVATTTEASQEIDRDGTPVPPTTVVQQHNDPTTLGKRSHQPATFARSLKILRDTAGSTNPLILLLLLPGLALLLNEKRLEYGWCFCVQLVWLVLLGTIGKQWFPHLELDRMLLVATVWGTIPAAYALTRALELCAARTLNALRSSVLLGALCVSPWCLATLTLNRTALQYRVSDETWDGVKTLIQQHNQNGRVLFSGFLLHDLDGGHAAPLPRLTGVPLIASSQFHNLWLYRQVFPKSFIERGVAGINEYLDLMNVGAVFAHERQWRQHFSDQPELFEQVGSAGRFQIFRRKNFTSNYFLQGSGKVVSQPGNLVIVELSAPSAVLKFNYFPFLTSSACTLTPYRAAPEVTLIKLDNCPLNTPITIRAVSPWRRLLQ